MIPFFSALEAERDCDSALNIDQNCIKALYRRGMARKHLFRYKLASDDFKRVLNLDPNNREAKRELDSIERLIDSKTVIDVKPIDKKFEFQSNKPLVKQKIIEKNCIKISEIEAKVPENVPKSYYQFECDWRQMVGNNCKDLRLKYLETIGSNRIQTLLTLTLEPQMMSELLDTISESNDFNLIYSLLKQMSRTPRFSTLVLFMSDSDQKVFHNIIEKLRRNGFEENLIKQIERQYL